MSRNAFFILALILFDGVAVGLGVWQYWTVRPSRKARPDQPSALVRASREDAGHPEG
jgi:hypothetical protein